MRSSYLKAALASLAFGFTAKAQIAEHCTTSNVCYRLNIPASTAQTGNGDIYFSISGPTTYSWIALGQGSNGMSNANVFVIYTNGNGNVTLSPRHASGEVMPRYDSSIDAELLAGSGVQNGVMVANVRCGNCQSWGTSGTMDFTGNSGAWITAHLSGNPIDSTNVQANFQEHSAHGEFTWSFASAVGGSSSNPFQDVTITTTTAGTQTNKSSVNTAVVLWCHGIFASLAFVILFPLGGILIRVASFPGLIWVHAGIQIFSWILFAAAFGLGLYYGIIDDYMKEAHPIIGIVLVALMLFQPLFGWLHHKRFVQTGARSASSYSHIWVGRIAIILGMVNGGLGMQLSGVSTAYMVVYSVLAGVMGAAYLGAIVYGEMLRKRRSKETPSGHEMSSKTNLSPARRSAEA